MSLRTVLLVHNHYCESGGEDRAFAAERDLLESRGHKVLEYRRDNASIGHGVSKVEAAVSSIWSRQSYAEVRQILSRNDVNIAHFHNTLPLISPAAYYACADAHVPVVQTLHNYRLLCPAATFYRDQRNCEDCLSSTMFKAVMHRCYRKSYTGSATVAAMLLFHRAIGTWANKVDVYIALTDFARSKFIEAGFPQERVVVKPNFLPAGSTTRRSQGQYALFLGRLAPEKGLGTLLEGWRLLRMPIPLKIGGDGPEKETVESLTEHVNAVDLLGFVSRATVQSLLSDAMFLVFPSEWYEGLPMTIIEAFAAGVPVITSRLGSMSEIVQDGRTGLHFKAGDSRDLAEKVEWAWTHPEQMNAMGVAAREEYESRYTPARNYDLLLSVYRKASARDRVA